MEIQYQVHNVLLFNHNFTHTWSAEHFLLDHKKLLHLTHSSLELGCDDYNSLDKAVEELEDGLDSIFTYSGETPELDASLNEPDAIAFSMSSGFLHSVNTISDSSKLKLAPCIKSHKL